MAFHPATFNLTVYDPSLYQGVPGINPLFQQNGPEVNPLFQQNGPGVNPLFQQNGPEVNPLFQQNGPGVNPFFQQNGFDGGAFGQPVGRRVGGNPGTVPSQYLDFGQDDRNFNNFRQPVPSELQGPLAFRNASSSPGLVRPRLSLPGINNSTFLQLPVLWTALSLALGVEVHGEVIRGLPCIKRLNQLFCRAAGTSYPSDKIKRFIDDNKALMRRMYGEFLDNIDTIRESTQQSQVGRAFSRQGRSAEIYLEDVPEFFTSQYHADDRRGESFFKHIRNRRQSNPGNANADTDRVDSCEGKVEIVTPYWANNASGKVRAVVNTNEFSQAIHQEICAKQSTKRCGGDCGCEQKYKWHRLLAYDPDDDCRGIFMDWFLFPSCCTCRCNP